jgi:thioredoxin-like negative regulator of GroEL
MFTVKQEDETMAVIKITDQNFETALSQYDIVFLKFTASWCGPCKSFAPIYDEVSINYPDVAFGEVDSEEEPELSTDFGVRSVPFLVVLRERIVVYTGAGALPKSALEDLVEQAKALNMEEVKNNLQESAKKDENSA